MRPPLLSRAAQVPNGVRALEAIDPALRQRLAAHHTQHLVQRRYSVAGELTSSTDKGDQASKVLEFGEIWSLKWHVLQVGRERGARCAAAWAMSEALQA